MRVVLDAHVVASRVLVPHGSAAALFAAWELGALEFAVSEEVLAEYERLLADPEVRSYSGLDYDDVSGLVAGFRRVGVLVEPPAHASSVDYAGQAYFDCARASGSEVVFAGDSRLQSLPDRDGITVLAPSAFMALVAIT